MTSLGRNMINYFSTKGNLLRSFDHQHSTYKIIRDNHYVVGRFTVSERFRGGEIKAEGLLSESKVKRQIGARLLINHQPEAETITGLY